LEEMNDRSAQSQPSLLPLPDEKFEKFIQADAMSVMKTQ